MIWNRIIFLSVVASLGVISASLCAPALPFIADHFSAKFSMIQFTISLFLVGNAFGQLVSGPLSDQIGIKKVLLGGLTLFILASIGCGLSSEMSLLLTYRFFQGMGSSVGPVLSRAMAAGYYSKERSAQVLSYGAMGVGLASMLSILSSGYLTLVSWRSNFYLAASLGVFLLIWTLYALKDLKASEKEKISLRILLSNMGAIFKEPQFLANTFCHTMTYGLMYGYIALFPFFLKKFHSGNNPVQVGIYSAYMIAFYMMGSFLAAKLVMKSSSKRLTQLGIALQGLSGALLMIGLPSFWFLMVIALFNISIGLILPLTSAAALSPFKGQAVGSASSALGLSYRFIGALISTGICQFSLLGGKSLGIAMVVFSLLSLLGFRLNALSSARKNSES